MPKQEYSDHDLLITLNAKFDNLSLDVKTMGDGLSGRVSLLERWKDEIDIYHAKIPLEKYEKLAQSYENLLANWKLITIIAVPILGIIIAVITELIKRYLHI